MLAINDDRNRSLYFGSAPRRVVSLVPSDTYNIVAIGCAGALVGRTDYCDTPAEVTRAIPSIGGTKNPNLDNICDLQPDLVLANQEENTQRDLETLASRGIRVFVGFPKRAIEGISHVARLARIFRVGDSPDVRALIQRGYEQHRAAASKREAFGGIRTFCPIWMNPLMTINAETFISDILTLAGATNVFAKRTRRYPLAADLGQAPSRPERANESRDTRYPRVTLQEVIEADPEVIVLPDEPHPFSPTDADVFRALPISAARSGRIHFINGKDICWYGARTIEGLPRICEHFDAARTAAS